MQDVMGIACWHSRHSLWVCWDRSAAYACLRTVASKVRETEALAAMFAVADALLSGRAEGKLRSVQDRVGIVTAVMALSAAPGKSRARVELAGTVATLLCKLYG